uniref:Putative secreted protein n=1 Tax=Anopheles marajoara TaxID=58244 RepID=A0A2M4CEW6_9DIPT
MVRFFSSFSFLLMLPSFVRQRNSGVPGMRAFVLSVWFLREIKPRRPPRILGAGAGCRGGSSRSLCKQP